MNKEFKAKAEEMFYDLHELWITEHCPEDYCCKDQLIELCEKQHRIEEFSKDFLTLFRGE
jgi:hypothetical protein